MIILRCLNCGKEYRVGNYRAETSHFCSRKCSGEYHYKDTLEKISHEHLKGNKHRLGKKPSNSFAKGHIPWNKGIKGIHLSPETEFKKGQKATNHEDVGTITERIDKFGKPRNFIKIAEPNIWKELYVYIWEKENGRIPKGFVIHHINKIPNDDRIENLMCITRAEHIELHRNELCKKNDKL